MELKDADSLKCNTLQVLINYPDGVKFRDFIGAFYQIHHFHPQFSHYGFSSLRHLLDGMRETVVVKGSQSSEPVMKLIDGLNFDGWLDEIQTDGLDTIEEEDSRLKLEERTRGKDTAAADLAEVLAAVTNLLIEYQSGLKFEKMRTLLDSTIGVDLQTFSIAKGYKDAIAFLDDQIPNLIIRRRGNLDKYVVQLSKDLTVASVPICSILKLYPDGLKLSKLKEAVKKKCGYDLDVFCYQIGYNDIVSCLQEIPELVVDKNRNRNCRVRLKSAPLGCSSYRSSSSSSDSDQPTCTSNSSNHDESEKRALLSKVMASLTALLSRYISGLRVKKLKYLLLTEEGIDLEKASLALGHKNLVEFLQQKVPPLSLNYRKKRLYSVAIKPLSVPLLKSTVTVDPPNSASDVPIPFLKSVETADLLNSEPVPFSWSSCLSSSSSSDSDESACASNNSNQDESEKRPVLSIVMALVTALLSNYKNGLRVKKLQDFLLTDEGIDLEKFSVAQGYKDTVEFLEQKMPQLMLNHQVNRCNTLVMGYRSGISKSASTASGLSTSDPQCQNIPASIAVAPAEVNNVVRITQCGPSTMSSNLPSFHESHNTVSVKAKSSPLFSSAVQSQQPNPCEPSAKSVTEQIPGNSHVAKFQHSTVQDELKQQVARVLGRHPKGLSLFQFRIAYSATFKQHFPVGNSASTKERLLEMPDVVCIKGQGVQTLLFPVSPDVSTAKPGQPASSKVDNVAAEPSLASVHPVPVTKPVVKTSDSHSVRTPHLDSPEKPRSKDFCTSKYQHQGRLLAPCQEQQKARTSLPGFSDQLSTVEDIPVFPGYFLQDEPLIVPQAFLVPAVPRVIMMPIPRPHPSFLQYYQSTRALENKPFTQLHTQSIPGSIKIMQTNTSHLNDEMWSLAPGPELRETAFIPHCPLALPTYPQGIGCDENLQPADKSLRRASLDRLSPAGVYQRNPTYANSLETSSNTESSIACSVSGSLHTSSVVTNNSSISSSVSSRTRAVSPASSQLDFTANAHDQTAYSSAKMTHNSRPLLSESQVSAQQRQYVREAATVISNTETTSHTSLSPEATTTSLSPEATTTSLSPEATTTSLSPEATTTSLSPEANQFAYASSRITTNSSAVSSETYAFTQTSEMIIALSTKTPSFISSLDSTTSLPCQDACASDEATITSSVLSKSTACQTADADFITSLTHDPPSQNNLTSSSSKQEDQSSSQQKKQVPVNPNPKTHGKCLIL